MTDNMSDKEAEEILRTFGDTKQTLHSFLTNIVKADDTIKLGNLTEEELGSPKLPVRTYKELALFSEEIADDQGWADYFNKMSEIQTSSSLSKGALLARLAVTLKKELADVTPKHKKNKGWFKKSDSPEEGQ